MEVPFRRYTSSDYEYNNACQLERKAHYIQKALFLSTDPDKKKRHEVGLCPVHYYDHTNIGGAAITKCMCGLCGEEMVFSSTSVDKVCAECAKTKQLCKYCGADIDLKRRRKDLPVR
jgi:hypothetical protein